MIRLATRVLLTFALVASTLVTGAFLVYVSAALPWWAVATAVLVWVLVIRRFKRGRPSPVLEHDPTAAQYSPTRTVGF